MFSEEKKEEYFMFFHQGKQYWEQQKLFVWSIKHFSALRRCKCHVFHCINKVLLSCCGLYFAYNFRYRKWFWNAV